MTWRWTVDCALSMTTRIMGVTRSFYVLKQHTSHLSNAVYRWHQAIDITMRPEQNGRKCTGTDEIFKYMFLTEFRWCFKYSGTSHRHIIKQFQLNTVRNNFIEMSTKIRKCPTLLTLCEGNPPVTGGSPHKGPITQAFVSYFMLP